MRFGICTGPVDPCIDYLPYNNSIEIFPPTEDTVIMRGIEYVKSIEVCNNDILHGVFYYAFWNEEFKVYNGLFFYYFEEENAFFIGGDFYFGDEFLDDVIKICGSFTPLE